MDHQRRLTLSCLAATALPLAAQVPSPHAIDIPKWFSNSLLDFRDEIPEAARAGKRVMLYFGQDGCPYCKALMKANFSGGPLTERVRRHYTAIAVNIWGDTEATWTDGRRFTEKTLARELKVQFTPTLIFFETDGRIALRLDGYLPPERMTLVLDYLTQPRRDDSLADYLAARQQAPALPVKTARPYLMRDPTSLQRRAGGKPLAVLFESAACKACAEMHDEAFRRPEVLTQLRRFDVASVRSAELKSLVTPDGRRVEARHWARDLGVNLHPTVIFFDDQGREAFRFDGYLRPFHIESAFDYVASGAYRREPQFQRYVQARADALRAAGKPVDLWR